MYAAHCRCVFGTCPLLGVDPHPVADVLHARPAAVRQIEKELPTTLLRAARTL